MWWLLLLLGLTTQLAWGPCASTGPAGGCLPGAPQHPHQPAQLEPFRLSRGQNGPGREAAIPAQSPWHTPPQDGFSKPMAGPERLSALRLPLHLISDENGNM